MTIPSLRTIPRALKLGNKIDLKKVLNWAKKGANLEVSHEGGNQKFRTMAQNKATKSFLSAFAVLS